MGIGIREKILLEKQLEMIWFYETHPQCAGKDLLVEPVDAPEDLEELEHALAVLQPGEALKVLEEEYEYIINLF